MTKEVMWSAREIPGQQAAIDLENRTQIMVSHTRDHTEAARALLEASGTELHRQLTLGS